LKRQPTKQNKNDSQQAQVDLEGGVIVLPASILKPDI